MCLLWQLHLPSKFGTVVVSGIGDSVWYLFAKIKVQLQRAQLTLTAPSLWCWHMSATPLFIFCDTSHFADCLSRHRQQGLLWAYTHTNTHLFNGPLSGTNPLSRYQKGKTSLDFTEAGHGEWQWHRLGHMPICTSLQTNNHASTPPLRFLQARCPSCRPFDSVNALSLLWS